MADNDFSINDAPTMSPGGEGVLGHIDQYELVRELGGGGFGTVYLARDAVSGIDVAVKGLPPFVKNNREEAENIRSNFALVSRLHHPNIAAALVLHPAKDVVYTSEDVRRKLRVDSGDTLMVMEYAPGVTLSQWRKQFPEKKVPVGQALEITRQIAAALDYAHERKIVHRDIKPANVMIETSEDGSVTARVLDFGLAAEIRSSMGRVSREIHDTSGTRPYMAPEQWLGGKQGPATDQYALAALFCELVTGEVPFAAVFDTGDPVVMMNVAGREPFVPPQDLPKPVRLALARALAKQPDGRFSSCGGFIAALEGDAKSFSRRERKENKGGVAGDGGKGKIVAAAALAAALAGGGYFAWTKYDAMATARKAETARIAAERTARAEAERKAEEERKAHDEEAARRRMETDAESIAYSLSAEMENASHLIKSEPEDVRTFFAADIRAFEKARNAGNDAKAHSKNITATNFLVQAKSRADALKKQVVERGKCLTAKGCADEAKRLADAVDAKAALASRYSEANRNLDKVSSLTAERKFAQALECAELSRRQFVALRVDSIKAALDVAKQLRDGERWAECIAAAENVIGWDPQNAEAGAIKRIARVRQLEIKARSQTANRQWHELEKTLTELVAAETNNAVAVECRKTLENSMIRDDRDLCCRLQSKCAISADDHYSAKCAKRRIRNFAFADLSCYYKNESLLSDAIMVGGGLMAVRYLVEQRGLAVDEATVYVKESPLFAAVKADDVETVRYLLSKGADVNRNAYAGCVPMYYAKSIAVAEVMVKAGANLDVVMYGSDKKPFAIADNKDYKLTRWLCDRGCRLIDEKHLYRTAAEEGELGFLKEHVNEVKNIPDLILSAVGGNKPEVITWLEGQGQSLACVDENGRTAVHCCNSTNMTLSLYQKIYEKSGHPVTLKDKHGATPLHMVANVEIMRFLLDRGADVSARDANEETPLMRASRRGNAEQVELLLTKGADVNARDKDGSTVLDHAVGNGNYAVAKMLLDKGCDANERNQRGQTILEGAVIRKDIDLVKLLVQSGKVSLELKDKIGMTPLFHAVNQRAYEIVSFLLANNANANVMMEPGHGWRTPLMRATYFDDVRMAKLLLEGGADANLSYEEGSRGYLRNAIGGAFHNKSKEMFRLLVAHGADPYKMTADGNNNFSLYNEEGRAFARFVLEETGAKAKSGEYVVKSAAQLEVVLMLCEKNATISVKNGDYRSLKKVEIGKSITIQGESREKTLFGPVDVYAAKDSGDIDCTIRSLSILSRNEIGFEAHGYNNKLSVQLSDCQIQSMDKCAFQSDRDVKMVVLRNCIMKGNDKYGTAYFDFGKEPSTMVKCHDSQIANGSGPAVNCNGSETRFYFENCIFTGSGEKTVSCGHDRCLFESCSFYGGRVGVKYGGHSKVHGCTFSGRESDMELKKVLHKLTESDFD